MLHMWPLETLPLIKTASLFAVKYSPLSPSSNPSWSSDFNLGLSGIKPASTPICPIKGLQRGLLYEAQIRDNRALFYSLQLEDDRSTNEGAAASAAVEQVVRRAASNFLSLGHFENLVQLERTLE